MTDGYNSKEFIINNQKVNRLKIFIIVSVGIVLILGGFVIYFQPAMYPGKNRIQCEDTVVELTITNTKKRGQRFFKSGINDHSTAIFSGRTKPTDIEFYNYPHYRCWMIKTQEDIIISPVMVFYLDERNGFLKLFRKKRYFLTVGRLFNLTRIANKIDFPVNDEIDQYILLLKPAEIDEKKTDPNGREKWSIFEFAETEVTKVIRNGIFVPDFDELQTLEQHPESNQIWDAFQRALDESQKLEDAGLDVF